MHTALSRMIALKHQKDVVEAVPSSLLLLLDFQYYFYHFRGSNDSLVGLLRGLLFNEYG